MNMQAYTGETISKCTVRICHNVLNYAWKNKILSFNYECQDMDCLQYGTLRLELLRVNKKERQKYNTGHWHSKAAETKHFFCASPFVYN